MKNKDERGVIRSRSEPALNPNRLKDKSLAPSTSTSTSLAANYRNIDASYDQGQFHFQCIITCIYYMINLITIHHIIIYNNNNYYFPNTGVLL